MTANTALVILPPAEVQIPGCSVKDQRTDWKQNSWFHPLPVWSQGSLTPWDPKNQASVCAPAKLRKVIVHSSVHYGTIARHGSNLSVHRWMNEDVVHMYKGILLSHEKE